MKRATMLFLIPLFFVGSLLVPAGAAIPAQAAGTAQGGYAGTFRILNRMPDTLCKGDRLLLAVEVVGSETMDGQFVIISDNKPGRWEANIPKGGKHRPPFWVAFEATNIRWMSGRRSVTTLTW